MTWPWKPCCRFFHTPWVTQAGPRSSGRSNSVTPRGKDRGGHPGCRSSCVSFLDSIMLFHYLAGNPGRTRSHNFACDLIDRARCGVA